MFIIMCIMFIKVNEVNEKVGMNVRLRRIKRGLSQEQLAELAEISPSTMGTVERGDKSSTIETIAKVANALGVDMYKLFVFED